METFAKILKNFDLVPFDVLMIGVGAALFVVLWRVLARVFFIPYLTLVEAREQATSGADLAAGDMRKRAEQIRRNYENRITAARVEAVKEKLDAVQAAKREAARILDKAEGQAQETLRSARWDMGRKIGELRTEILREADRIAGQIVDKLMRPAQPAAPRESVH